MLRPTWGLALCVAAAWAQRPPVEVFGHVGLFRAGSDEGKLGSAAGFGGAVTVPLTRRLALDFDVETARFTEQRTPDFFYTSRRTLLAPSLLYRWGSASAYVFTGGGVGGEHESTVTRDSFTGPYTPPPPWRQVAPRVFEFHHGEWSNLYHGRAGFVVSPAPRIPIRVETYFANWHLGLRIAAGYRFGRR